MQNSTDKSNVADLVAAVRVAARDAKTLDTLRDILAAAQRDVLRLNLPCQACGTCCDFDAMDHRLFVSTAELALLMQIPSPAPPAPLLCPYQQGPSCIARDRRPLGCRMFYCDLAAQDSLHDLYETYHQRIVLLHQEADIPYAYAEMTGWLKACWVEF